MNPRLEDYLTQLSHYLRFLPEAERTAELQEIRQHFELRTMAYRSVGEEPEQAFASAQAKWGSSVPLIFGIYVRSLQRRQDNPLGIATLLILVSYLIGSGFTIISTLMPFHDEDLCFCVRLPWSFYTGYVSGNSLTNMTSALLTVFVVKHFRFRRWSQGVALYLSWVGAWSVIFLVQLYGFSWELSTLRSFHYLLVSFVAFKIFQKHEQRRLAR